MQVVSISAPALPAAVRALVDDAAVFPPGEAPLPRAVAAHAAHRTARHAALVGPFVIGSAALPRLSRLATADLYGVTPLRVNVVVPDPNAVADAVRAVDAAPYVELAGLEVKLIAGASPAWQVAAIAAAGSRVPTYVEVPRPGATTWPAAADAVAEHGLRLKFRTGGVTADLFPDEREVATWVRGAVDRRTPFKCTAGLHHAVRHTAPTTGFEHHGYLNVLVAALAATAGADVDALRATLAERGAERLADAVRDAGPEALHRARSAFASYGSCSVTEPYDDLVALGLLADAPDPRPTSEEIR